MSRVEYMYLEENVATIMSKSVSKLHNTASKQMKDVDNSRCLVKTIDVINCKSHCSFLLRLAFAIH